MADSVFDPQTMLDAEQTGEFNTEATPAPEGIWFASICNVNYAQGISAAGRAWDAVDFTFETDDEEAKRMSGLTRVRVRMDRMFLDMTGEGEARHLTTASEDVNANIDLGKLRAALGMKPGKGWRWSDLQGMGCWIKTQHVPHPTKVEAPPICKIVTISKDRIRG